MIEQHVSHPALTVTSQRDRRILVALIAAIVLSRGTEQGDR